ncbi:hypothetical protein JCM33374_g3256 [Metschnikowia sp. JCM 33374]|nr:hypothetical protein JCM33374_g3256 [Metschnikowia sp. JCM 33374]
MRSTTFAFTALASLAAASAESIFFTAKSDDNSINAPISSIHEGAGINYFLVAQGGSGEVFDLTNGVATTKQGPFTANVGVSGPYFAAGPAISPETLTFKGDVLDTNNFWACKNTGDPYSYSANSYIVAVTDKGNNTAPFASCSAVKILKSSSGSASSSSAAAASSVASTAVSSAAPVSSAASVSSSAGWSNVSVITTDITVTGYTTYCPESTVVTVTTCSAQKCAPSVITVTQATTITVTGECVVPTTLTSAAPVSTTSKAPQASSTLVTKASSSAAPSSTASVSSFHAGAGKAAVGVAGLAGVVAMLI